MNKKFRIYAIIWAILFAVFQISCFVSPNELAGMSKFGGAFWAGYIFVSLAFFGQLICAYVAFQAKNNTKLFYNIPIIRISYTGLILTTVFGVLAMALPNLPNWIAAVVCLLILALTAVAVIKAKAASDIVENIDNSIKSKTYFMKALATDAERLMSRAETPEEKTVCKKIYEAIRYSDPMSSVYLADIENQITAKFNAFANVIVNAAVNQRGAAQDIADELLILIDDRNKKCKLLK